MKCLFCTHCNKPISVGLAKMLSRQRFDDGLPDDVLIFSFTFLTPDQIISVGNTCARWRALANDESLWQEILERASLSEKSIHTRTSYLSYMQSKYEQRKLTEEYQFHGKHIESLLMRRSTIYAVGLLACAMLGLIYLTFQAPLMLDEIISDDVRWLIPSVVLFGLPFTIMAITMLINELVYVRKYSRYITVAQSSYYLLVNGLRNTYALIGSFGWMPITTIGVYAHNTGVISRWHILIVILLYMLIFVTFSLLHWSQVGTKEGQAIFIAGIIINMVATGQVVLVLLKLQGVTNLYWIIVTIPLWLTLSSPIVGCIIIFSYVGANFVVCKFGKGVSTLLSSLWICFIALPILPIAATIMWFSLRLDEFVHGPYVLTFVPVYVLYVLALISIFITGVIYLRNRRLRKLE
jgi:hypothetical protein